MADKNYETRIPGFKPILILFAMFFLISCNAEDMAPTAPDEITGFYEAIKWTDIGIGDWQVDMLAAGSSLNAQLTDDFNVLGHIFIPANIGSDYPLTDQDFTGTFTLVSDTLRFQNTGDIFLDAIWLSFLVKGDSLESVDVDGPLGVFKIILEKR